MRNLDSFGAEDLSTPEIKLVQNLGCAEAKDQGAVPGDFYMPVTETIIKGKEGFRFIVADIHKMRTYWGRSEINTDPPECSSSNALEGVSDSGIDCMTCPHRNDTPWSVPREERKNLCQTSYAIVGILYSEDKTPFLLRAAGMSASAGKDLITALRMNRALNNQFERALIRCTSAHVKTPNGEAYVLKLTIERVLPEEQLPALSRAVASVLGEGYDEKPAQALPPATTATQASAAAVQEAAEDDEIPFDVAPVKKEADAFTQKAKQFAKDLDKAVPPKDIQPKTKAKPAEYEKDPFAF